MSSSPLSSKNTFVQSQAQFLNRQNSNGNSNSPMNINRQSPGVPSSSTATRIVGPRPFYRSKITPDPFDYTNNTRLQNDNQQYVHNQRRYSVNQINGKKQQQICMAFIACDLLKHDA